MMVWLLGILKHWKIIAGGISIAALFIMFIGVQSLRHTVDSMSVQLDKAQQELEYRGEVIDDMTHEHEILNRQLMEREQERQETQERLDNVKDKLRKYADANEDYGACRGTDLPYDIDSMYGP